MTAGIWNNLGNKFGNIGGALANALLGSASTTVNQPQGQYPDAIQNYLDNMENQPYMQKLLNQPKQTGLSLDQYKEGFAQGLNFGVPEIADAQDALKINKPKTGEEIDLARQGQFNTYPLKTGLTTGPRQGGFLNDFAKGYQENYQNAFDANNLVPQNKSWATRIGEGLGSVGRFIDSPLGRGLIAYGLNNALGYDDSVIEGLNAFIGRQNAQTADNIYRQNLAQNGIDLSGIRGNVTSDIYKQVSNDLYRQQSLQAKRDIAEAKDNVSRARMIMTALNNGTITPQEAQIQMANYGVTLNDVQESNNTRLLPYRQYAMQVAPQVALGNLGVAQGNLALRQAELPYDMAYKQMQIENLKNKNNSDKTTLKALTENNATLADIDAGIQAITENPSAYSWAKGKLGADIANRIDPKGVGTRTQIDNITAVYRKWLTGAQMSDQERKAYERFLPAPTDNAQIVKAKLQGMKSSIERKNQAMMQGLQPTQTQTNSNPLGLNL